MGRAIRTALSIRQNDPAQIGARFVERSHVTNTTYQGAFALRGQRFESRVAGFAIGTGHANLDQFVIVQRPLRLGDDTRAHPGVADKNDGFEGVGEAAQVAALFFC